MFKHILLAASVLLASLALAEPTSLNWHGSLTPYGFRLTCPKGKLSHFSRIVAVEPPWKQHRLYTKHTPLKATVRKQGNTTVTTLESQNKTTEIYLNEWSLTATPSRWTINTDLRQNGNAPTKVEYVLMTIPKESLLLNGTISWMDTNYNLHTDKLKQATMGPIGFLSLDIPTVFGILNVKADKGTLKLYDRRTKPFIIDCMWIGILVAPISKDAPFQHKATISLRPYQHQPKELILMQPDKNTPTTIVDTPALNRNVPDQQLNIPVPKQRQDLPGQDFIPTRKLTVSLPNDFDTPRLRNAIARTLGRLSLDCTFSSEAPQVVVQCNPDLKGYDAYDLSVTKDRITIQAAQEPAVFYAFQTLAMNARKGTFPGCHIQDQADFQIRGMHLIPDNTSMLFHAPLFEKVLAPLKINHLIMEAQYVKWDATSYFHHPRGMSKEDLVKLLQIAHDNYIQVTPQIQTFGHSQWLFYGGKNLDLADNPSRPVDYHVANPKTYQLIEKILDEVVATFKTDTIHIGHDEITMVSTKKPCRKEAQNKSIQQIVLDDFLWYYDYANRKNLKLMFWHDMLVNSDQNPNINGYGIASLRSKLPTRNATVCYWDYSQLREDFPGIDVFQNLGFQVWPVAWYPPNNIENLACYAKKRKLKAMLTSTWAGYFGMDTVLQREFRQISAYVRLAAYAWNADKKVNQNHDYDQALIQLLEDGKPPQPVFPGSLLQNPNVPLIALEQTQDPFQLGHLFGLNRCLAPQTIFCGDIQFAPFKRQGIPAALTLASTIIPTAPKTATVTLGKKATKLYFLHTILLEITQGINIATYSVNYQDGTSLDIPIRYGYEINNPLRQAQLGFDYRNTAQLTWNGNKGKLGYFKWTNPKPDKIIESITFKNGNIGYPFFLFGLSFN